MYLSKLKLTNFKNILEEELDFCPNVNCIVGHNGMGKTNLLDAIHYLSFCKSYFNVIDSNNINHQYDFFALHGFYCFDDKTDNRYSCSLKRGGKKSFKNDNKEYTRLSRHIGKIPLVMITPSDQELIVGGSELRRRFLDLVISQADVVYLDSLMQYNKALEQRNKLLKYFNESRSFDEVSLGLWDEQLIRYGKSIYLKRREFVEEFSEPFQYYYNFITSNKENVCLDYISKNFEDDFEKMLIDTRERDLYIGYTSLGIHKDDLGLMLNGYSIKKFASQGQQKSFLLALKLAQFEYLYKQRNIKPILLLDDVFDKLDLNRIKQLISLVGSDRFGQVFLTDTQLGRVEKIFEHTDIEHKIYNISEGGVSCDR